MSRDNVYKYRLLWMISALFNVQSFPKWFVHFWMTFCENSMRISCQINFVNKHWPQSWTCPFNTYSITEEFAHLILEYSSIRFSPFPQLGTVWCINGQRASGKRANSFWQLRPWHQLELLVCLQCWQKGKEFRLHWHSFVRVQIYCNYWLSIKRTNTRSILNLS